MAAPSARRLCPADAPAGEKVRIAFQISSKVNVPDDREIPYGGHVPASSKAAAAGHTGPMKGCSAPDGQGLAKGSSTTGAAKMKSEPEKPSGAVVKAGCIDCIEEPSGAAKSGCIENKPSGAVVKSSCIDCIEKPSGAVESGCIEKPSGAVVKSGCIDCIDKSSGAVVKAKKAGRIVEEPYGPDVTGDGVLTPVGDGLWQLPDGEVQWVLSRRREDVNADLFGPDCVEAVNAVKDEFFEYQAWVRAQCDANGGRVFVDDQFVAEREERQRWMSTWSERIEYLGLADSDFSDRLSDFYEDSEEDEVEVQELDTN